MGAQGSEEVGRTLRAAVDAYLSARRHELAVHTRRNLSGTLGNFVEFTGPDLRVGGLKAHHATRWIAHHSEQVGPAKLRSDQSRLRVFSRWLVTNRYLKADPCAELAKIRVPRGSTRD